MKSLAILPLRAGSKSIQNKNRKRILGRPLYLWMLTEAIYSRLDEIYVFTDDNDIISFVDTNFSWTDKVKCISRSKESATDTASTEMAMLELAEKINYNFDIYCLLQATSPLTTRHDINKTLEQVESGNHDSALTVVEYKRFTWNENGQSLNYDYKKRPRRQNFEGMLVENGAVYACARNIFMETKNRLGGDIGIVKMEDHTLMEIDEPDDFVVVEQLLKAKLQKQRSDFKESKCLCLDVDGVFTKATVDVGKEGEMTKEFSLRDGMGLNLLEESGMEIFVVTSEHSPIIEQRMKKLGIRNYYLGIKDKYSFLENILNARDLCFEDIAYMGDDINDLPIIIAAGLTLCPADAEPVVKQNADIIMNSNGGERVIREACEFLIKYNERLKKQ